MADTLLFTLGFTKKDARTFFETIERAGVRRVLDVRLNNVSQLAGFTKQPDLEFFLHRLLGVEYRHVPDLAPDKDLLDAYRAKAVPWETYEARFRQLLAERRVHETLSPDLLHQACLLCSEPTPEHCHRRLAAEYLQGHWPGVRIVHL